jgi:hypothetical protein
MNLFNRQFRITLLLLVLLEELSFLGYLLPAANGLIFWLIAAVSLGLAIWRLECAVWLVLVELLVGSKGYLFFSDVFGARISIRIALWSIVMLVWLITTLASLIREKNFVFKTKNFISSLKTGERRSLTLLALFILWAFINGLVISHNGSTDTFLDFNGWLFFLLIFPAASVLRKRENLENLMPLLAAAAIWLAIKTFFLAFIFSHYTMDTAAFRLYRWVRVSGVGEITQVKGGFFRIFFQSQIYTLISFFLLCATLTKLVIGTKFSLLWHEKKFWLILCGLSVFLAVVLFSMSRSFWLGLLAGLLLLLPYIYLEAKKLGQNFLKKLSAVVFVFFTALIFSVAIVVGTVTFPVPPAIGGFDTDSLLNSRFDSDEAAVVSRWELLPKLWQKITASPILGFGFGTNLTYKSSDPRQLLSPNKGIFTTYTFEWGWLDVWLKLGFFGCAVYLLLLYQLAKNTLRNQAVAELSVFPAYGLFIALIALTVINFFTPYLNHPLGIGYLIFLFSINQTES